MLNYFTCTHQQFVMWLSTVQLFLISPLAKKVRSAQISWCLQELFIGLMCLELSTPRVKTWDGEKFRFFQAATVHIYVPTSQRRHRENMQRDQRGAMAVLFQCWWMLMVQIMVQLVHICPSFTINSSHHQGSNMAKDSHQSAVLAQGQRDLAASKRPQEAPWWMNFHDIFRQVLWFWIALEVHWSARIFCQ